ncbi:hypothetical protein V6N13_027932 [Hibiscus sabdariffa]
MEKCTVKLKRNQRPACLPTLLNQPYHFQHDASFPYIPISKHELNLDALPHSFGSARLDYTAYAHRFGKAPPLPSDSAIMNTYYASTRSKATIHVYFTPPGRRG